jgi:hypothetical protein
MGTGRVRFQDEGAWRDWPRSERDSQNWRPFASIRGWKFLNAVALARLFPAPHRFATSHSFAVAGKYKRSDLPAASIGSMLPLKNSTLFCSKGPTQLHGIYSGSCRIRNIAKGTKYTPCRDRVTSKAPL